MKTHLLLIDPQNDFIDLPDELLPPTPHGKATPALPVAGAHQDMLRLADWIAANTTKLDAITVTLDHHHRLDIAHPPFWRTGKGETIAPFTTITADQVEQGLYKPAKENDLARALEYLRQLEATARMTHMVWPIHCQIGTWGQTLHASVQRALDNWEDARARPVTHVLKGENPWTEHYSALRAEIPDPADPATALNQALLQSLAQADVVYVVGEAGSHCVRATVEHLAANWPHDLGRIVLLTDAMSPVPGFEAVQEQFLADMQRQGLRLAKTTTLPL